MLKINETLANINVFFDILYENYKKLKICRERIKAASINRFS
jgi:hypothetical protein